MVWYRARSATAAGAPATPDRVGAGVAEPLGPGEDVSSGFGLTGRSGSALLSAGTGTCTTLSGSAPAGLVGSVGPNGPPGPVRSENTGMPTPSASTATDVTTQIQTRLRSRAQDGRAIESTDDGRVGLGTVTNDRGTRDWLIGTVLNLPGVVEHMPRDAPGGVPGGPGLAGRRRTPGWLAEHVQDGLVLRHHGRRGGRRGQPQAELAGVGPLGLVHVRDDRVAVPATAARAVAQLRRGFADRLVKDGPDGGHQIRPAQCLGRRERECFGIGGLARRTEVGGRVAG